MPPRVEGVWVFCSFSDLLSLLTQWTTVETDPDRIIHFRNVKIPGKWASAAPLEISSLLQGTTQNYNLVSDFSFFLFCFFGAKATEAMLRQTKGVLRVRRTASHGAMAYAHTNQQRCF